MPEVLQADRWLKVDTPLGADILKLAAFDGEEGLSTLFSYRLDLISEESDLDPLQLLGKSITFSVQRADGTRRYFNGIGKRFTNLAIGSRGLRGYSAEIVPKLWLLTRHADCRIFQNKTVPQIIEQILSDRGITDYEMKARGHHPSHEYCVQYRETDFAFICRLMEEEGIFYFFRHADGQHTLVMADQATGYEDCTESSVEFRPGATDWDAVHSWVRGSGYISGKVTTRDYNYLTPTANMESSTPSLVQISGNSGLELYDYHGRYDAKSSGDQFAQVHMEEEETGHETVDGSGSCMSFTPGGKFSFSNMASESGKTYLVTRIRHWGTDPTHVSGQGGRSDYRNSFSCMASTSTFRPPRVTPKGVVHGPQTAVVVGPSGEEIYTDEHSRIKVQFHWDRVGTKNENSSCWIRVAQGWAGTNWGQIFIPRIGQEVVVVFLEGDPDRPLVVGSVYNADLKPPYTLPDNKTQSGVLTRSSKNGSAANANELRFEDKKGSEEVFFHAEKDFKREVENDDSLDVGHDQTITVKNNRTEEVTQGNESVTVKQGNRTVEISMGNESLTIKMGNQTTKLNLGASTTEAMQSIELKVGASSVKVDQMGVTIKGGMISIQGTMTAELKSPMTTVNGSGMLTVSGGMIMIG